MIFKANGYDDSTMHYVGNGKMLLCGNGTEIWSLQGTSYSSPVFASLRMCDDFESESMRITGSLCYEHGVYVGKELLDNQDEPFGIPPVKLIDYMDPEREIFVRRSHSCQGYEMRLQIPPYVRKYRYENYKFDRCETVYAYVIPANTCYFEHFCYPKETRMLICAKDDVEFDGECFKMGEGSARIIIASGDDPVSTLDNMKYALRHCNDSIEDDVIYVSARNKWSFLTKRCGNIAAENAAISLLARLSRKGGVLASHGLMMADTQAFPYIAKAFKSLGLDGECDMLARFYLDKIASDGNGKAHCFYSADCDDRIEDINQGLSSACVLKGLMICLEGKRLKSEQAQILKSLFYTAKDSLTAGAVPFCSNEREMTMGIISKDCAFQGSAKATCLVISACREFMDFAQRHGIRLRDDAKSIKSALDEAVRGFTELFSFEGEPVANTLRTESKIKRSRFVYSKCTFCQRQGKYAPITWLERDKYGSYLCPDCFSRRESSDGYRAGRVSILSYLCAALLEGVYSREMTQRGLEIISERARIFVNDPSELPVRPAYEDILVSDVLMKYGMDYEGYNAALDNLSDSAGLFAEYVSGETHLGNRGDSHAVSVYLCNLLSRE